MFFTLEIFSQRDHLSHDIDRKGGEIPQKIPFIWPQSGSVVDKIFLYQFQKALLL